MEKYWELAELEKEVFLRRPFWIFLVSHFDFFLLHLCEKSSPFLWGIIFSVLWMVFSESWKRSCPNFNAHVCTYVVILIALLCYVKILKSCWPFNRDFWKNQTSSFDRTGADKSRFLSKILVLPFLQSRFFVISNISNGLEKLLISHRFKKWIFEGLKMSDI